MSTPTEADRAWPRRLRVTGAVLMVAAAAIGVSLALGRGAAAQDGSEQLIERGLDIYGAQCARCHGANAQGTIRSGVTVPSLRGVGAATVDFYVRTGRMPIQSVFDRSDRGEPQLTDAEREALTAYLTSLPGPGGPPIPDVTGWEEAELSRGLDLFTTNCAACHGPTGEGIALGQEDIAPSLHRATPLEIAEAVRVGPGVMPVFGPDTYTEEDVEAVVKWVMDLRTRRSPGGVHVGRTGPVSEGLIAWVVGMGGLGVVMYVLGEQTEQETVIETEGGGDGD